MASNRVPSESNFHAKVKRMTKEKEWKLGMKLTESQNNDINDEVLCV